MGSVGRIPGKQDRPGRRRLQCAACFAAPPASHLQLLGRGQPGCAARPPALLALSGIQILEELALGAGDLWRRWRCRAARRQAGHVRREGRARIPQPQRRGRQAGQRSAAAPAPTPHRGRVLPGLELRLGRLALLPALPQLLLKLIGFSVDVCGSRRTARSTQERGSAQSAPPAGIRWRRRPSACMQGSLSAPLQRGSAHPRAPS